MQNHSLKNKLAPTKRQRLKVNNETHPQIIYTEWMNEFLRKNAVQSKVTRYEEFIILSTLMFKATCTV